jgi:hypothetical protein
MPKIVLEKLEGPNGDRTLWNYTKSNNPLMLMHVT